MARKWNKVLAFALALCMCAGSMNVSVWATTTTETVDNADGTSTEITTTTKETTDSEGNLTVTVTVEKSTDGTTTDGVDVDRDETRVETTVTDENGEVVQASWEEDGTETKEWTEKDDGSEAGQPEVEVPLEPGKTTTGTATTTETTGNINSENGQTTTTTTDRTVTAATSEVTTKVNDVDTGIVGEQETGLKGIAPVYDTIDGIKEDKGGMFDYQFNSGATSEYANPENWDMPEDADVRYVGTGEHSKYYVAVAYVEYEKDANGNTLRDENGDPIIKEIRRYKDETSDTITIDGEPTKELPTDITLEPMYDNYGGSRPFIFMMMDENKNKFYGYCCDLGTDTASGSYYKIVNLEDSEYFASEKSEEHIRSIVMNGYWGTSDIPDKDGTYQDGSLEKMKADLKEAINSGKMQNETIEVPKKDENGNIVVNEDGDQIMESITMLEMIDGLTEGEALLATQAAIWSYANGSYNVSNGKDGSIVIDPDGYKWNQDPWDASKAGEAMDDCGSARVDFLYKWLINLETKEESTVVINEKNFVEDMQLTVKDKAKETVTTESGEVEVKDYAENTDDKVDNDIYNVDISFKLIVDPGTNDDLILYLMDNNNNIIRKTRLAGDDTNDAKVGGFTELVIAEDGSYVFEDLQLAENSDITFDLRLEGTQYLENGVYVYEAVNGRTDSQTFVGIAEGSRNVDVSASVTINFNVDENNYVKTERKWHDESDPVWTPTEKPEYPEDDEHDDDKDIPEDPVPLSDLVDILDEEIPLANVPQTGVNNTPWSLMVVAAGLALAAVLGKKNK